MPLPLVHTILIVYPAVNLLSFALMGADKRRARRGMRRIRERTLLLVCALGGGLGGWLGMQVFRHKTRHYKFTLTVPVLMLLQLVLLAWGLLR
ncbi:MAG: DUF1294 domain-containing protein [Oscillospiraceae bacterium]|jgi:uncharacterized membrane protein YsdA (DUF1294 family)|nr:DUF1294 domain-containing protein [Oscillospiraceae bacterium]